jgi:tRNA(Ile)-lysidine synthase TilS/MesJ
LKERFVKAMATYHLIEDDDKILVGLSGGKDSLLLTELLAKRAKIQHPRFSVEAIHVRMENIHYETDTSYLQQFCDDLGVPLHVRTTSFETSVISTEQSEWRDLSTTLEMTEKEVEMTEKEVEMTEKEVEMTEKEVEMTEKEVEMTTAKDRRRQKQPCFLCSWNRRKQLFNLAQELGCNKIALGHHQDDLIHTALMNLTYQAHFATMPARLKMRKMPLTIIRPLCLIPESDIKTWAEMQGYQKQQKLCPYETNSHRTDIKQLYDALEQMNPEVRYNIWGALEADNKLIEE